MKEARIECRCTDIMIEDIRVRFRRGDIAWLSEARAEKSTDLKHAVERGALKLTWVERCRTEKAPEPERKVVAVPVVPKPVGLPAPLPVPEPVQVPLPLPEPDRVRGLNAVAVAIDQVAEFPSEKKPRRKADK